MPNEKIEVKEQMIEVSEIRIRNTIKEFKKGIPFGNAASISLGSTISFVTAFAAFSNTSSVWKWVFLVCLMISSLCFFIFGIISIARYKSLKGTEKWFLDELKNTEHQSTNKRSSRLSKKGKKILFNICNFGIIICTLTTILLLVLGLNGWNVSKQEWAPAFWAFYIVFGLAYLFFGTYINALLAAILFGYEDGFPGSD